MTNLKYRLLTILALIVASLWALFPRTVIERVKRDGIFVYDTAILTDDGAIITRPGKALRRQELGASPVSRLNARLNASSES